MKMATDGGGKKAPKRVSKAAYRDVGANGKSNAAAYKRSQSRSNKGGATRGQARANQVHTMKSTGSRNKAPRRLPVAAVRPTGNPALVGIDAYRGYADSVAHAVKNPTGGGLGLTNPFAGVNLNPFDALGNLGNGIRDIVSRTPNPSALIREEAERIRDVTSR